MCTGATLEAAFLKAEGRHFCCPTVSHLCAFWPRMTPFPTLGCHGNPRPVTGHNLCLPKGWRGRYLPHLFKAAPAMSSLHYQRPAANRRPTWGQVKGQHKQPGAVKVTATAQFTQFIPATALTAHTGWLGLCFWIQLNYTEIDQKRCEEEQSLYMLVQSLKNKQNWSLSQ